MHKLWLGGALVAGILGCSNASQTSRSAEQQADSTASFGHNPCAELGPKRKDLRLGIKQLLANDETKQLEKDKKRASRKENDLTLTLKAGKTATFHTHALQDDGKYEGGGQLQYTYITYLPELKAYAVKLENSAANIYLLIEEGSGKVWEVYNLPILSPSARQFIVTVFDLDLGIYPSEIHIYEVMQDGGFRQAYTLTTFDQHTGLGWGGSLPIWQGEDNICLERFEHYSAEDPKENRSPDGLKRSVVSLVRQGQNWQLQP